MRWILNGEKALALAGDTLQVPACVVQKPPSQSGCSVALAGRWPLCRPLVWSPSGRWSLACSPSGGASGAARRLVSSSRPLVLSSVPLFTPPTAHRTQSSPPYTACRTPPAGLLTTRPQRASSPASSIQRPASGVQRPGGLTEKNTPLGRRREASRQPGLRGAKEGCRCRPRIRSG